MKLLLTALPISYPEPQAALALVMVGAAAGIAFGLWLRSPRQHHVRIDQPVKIELRNLRVVSAEQLGTKPPQ